MTSSPMYWSTLESHFHDILGQTLQLDEEQLRLRWLVAVKEALGQAWEHHRVSVLTADAWTLRALVKGERSVRTRLKQLGELIRSLTPNLEGG